MIRATPSPLTERASPDPPLFAAGSHLSSSSPFAIDTWRSRVSILAWSPLVQPRACYRAEAERACGWDQQDPCGCSSTNGRRQSGSEAPEERWDGGRSRPQQSELASPQHPRAPTPQIAANASRQGGVSRRSLRVPNRRHLGCAIVAPRVLFALRLFSLRRLRSRAHRAPRCGQLIAQHRKRNREDNGLANEVHRDAVDAASITTPSAHRRVLRATRLLPLHVLRPSRDLHDRHGVVAFRSSFETSPALPS
jgi:hypothetical protein